MILLYKYVRIEKIFKRIVQRLKNLVVKTALVTLISVLVAIIVTFAMLIAFAPGFMFKVTSRLGMDKTALSFAVRQYEKTEEITDLADVVYLASEIEDYDRLSKYSKELLYHEDFTTYASTQKGGYDKYAEYVMTNYVLSLVETSNINTADEVFNLYEKFYTFYSINNPIYRLIRFTSDYDTQVEEKLNLINDGQNVLLAQDLALVKSR